MERLKWPIWATFRIPEPPLKYAYEFTVRIACSSIIAKELNICIDKIN